MVESIYIPFKDTVLVKGDLFRLRTKGKIIASVAIHSNILVSLMQITKEVDAFVIRLSHGELPGKEALERLSFECPCAVTYNKVTTQQDAKSLTITFSSN